MNIDEYLAIKASEMESGHVAQAEQAPTTTIGEGVQETPQGVGAPEPQEPEATVGSEIPSVIKYGEQEFKVEELVQTKQQFEELTKEQQRIQQELEDARVAREYYQAMMKNPAYAKTFAENNGLKFVDPSEQEKLSIERKYNQLLLEREIENMQLKHKDFNPKEVISFAVERNINNLEDAYLLHKARSGGDKEMDVNALKEQILQEVKNELQYTVNTGSMIGASGGGAKQVQDSAPVLSSHELKIAQNLGLSPQEYAKFK